MDRLIIGNHVFIASHLIRFSNLIDIIITVTILISHFGISLHCVSNKFFMHLKNLLLTQCKLIPKCEIKIVTVIIMSIKLENLIK